MELDVSVRVQRCFEQADGPARTNAEQPLAQLVNQQPAVAQELRALRVLLCCPELLHCCDAMH